MRRRALILVGVLLVAATTLGVALRGAGAEGVTRATDGRPLVALTFDDGLNGATTIEVASQLERRGAQGTFFVVGRTLAGQRDVALRLIEGGHLLGNHSEEHERATPEDTRYATLAAAHGVLRRRRLGTKRRAEVGGTLPRDRVNRGLRRAGMRTVLWDVEVADWSETDAELLATHVLERLRPGSIVLLHDGSDGVPGADRSVLLRALPRILEGIETRGWQAVRVDTLLNERGYIDRC